MTIDARHHAALSVAGFDAAVAWWAEMFDMWLSDERTPGDIRIVAQGRRGPLNRFAACGVKQVALTVTDPPAAGLTGGCDGLRGARHDPPGFAYGVLRAPGANQAELVQPA